MTFESTCNTSKGKTFFYFCQEDGLILQQAHQNIKNVKEIILENWILCSKRPSKDLPKTLERISDASNPAP